MRRPGGGCSCRSRRTGPATSAIRVYRELRGDREPALSPACSGHSTTRAILQRSSPPTRLGGTSGCTPSPARPTTTGRRSPGALGHRECLYIADTATTTRSVARSALPGGGAVGPGRRSRRHCAGRGARGALSRRSARRGSGSGRTQRGGAPGEQGAEPRGAGVPGSGGRVVSEGGDRGGARPASRRPRAGGSWAGHRCRPLARRNRDRRSDLRRDLLLPAGARDASFPSGPPTT